jgi:hypothetical protein
VTSRAAEAERAERQTDKKFYNLQMQCYNIRNQLCENFLDGKNGQATGDCFVGLPGRRKEHVAQSHPEESRGQAGAVCRHCEMGWCWAAVPKAYWPEELNRSNRSMMSGTLKSATRGKSSC